MKSREKPIRVPGGRREQAVLFLRRSQRMSAMKRAAFAPVAIVFLVAAQPARAQKAPVRPPVPENVLFEPDVEYANPDGQHLQLDLARPKTGDGPFPAVVCIHGGGFRAGKREGYDALTVKLAQKGYVAATVSYRLAPKYQFPAAVHDTKAAIRFLRAN